MEGKQEPPWRVQRLTLRIDGANFTLPYPFTYVSDPSVHRISPLESFMSGGRQILVMGTSFASLQQPKMGVFNGHGLVNDSLCTVLNDTLLVCPSPSVLEQTENKNNPLRSALLLDDGTMSGNGNGNGITSGMSSNHNHQLRLRVGFSMDADSSNSKDLERHYSELIRYVADPTFFAFANDGMVKAYSGESLVIDGENLRLAASEGEVNVTIGSRPCNLTSLSMTQLVCTPPPPDQKPGDTDELGRKTDNELPAVVVRVGSNIRYQVGYLRYEMSSVQYGFPPLLIGLLSVGGALLVLLSLLLLAFFRHRRSQAEREYKIIQLQMGTLKSQVVGMECRQIGHNFKQTFIRPDLPPRNGGNALTSTLKRNLPLSLKSPNYGDSGENESMNPYTATSPLDSHYQSVDERNVLHPYITRNVVSGIASDTLSSHYAAIDDPSQPYPRMLHLSKQPIYESSDNERMRSTLYPRNLYEAAI